MNSRRAILSILVAALVGGLLGGSEALARTCRDVLGGRRYPMPNAFNGYVQVDKRVKHRAQLIPPSQDRPTIVLVGGLDSSLKAFDSLAAYLTKHGYGILRVELRGQGESMGVGPLLRYPLDLQVQDLKKIIDTVGLTGDVQILGYSWGGAVAARYATLSGRVENLFLDKAFRENMELFDVFFGPPMRMMKMGMDFVHKGMYETMNSFNVSMMLRYGHFMDPTISPMKATSMGRMYDGLENFNMTAELKNLPRGKIHISSGRYDQLNPHASLEDLYKQLPEERRGMYNQFWHYHNGIEKEGPLVGAKIREVFEGPVAVERDQVSIEAEVKVRTGDFESDARMRSDTGF